MKKLTKKQIKEYLSKSSLLCPFCGIQDVEFEEPEWVDVHECIQRAECLSCKQIWMFFYTLTDIVPIEREEEEENKMNKADEMNKLLEQWKSKFEAMPDDADAIETMIDNEFDRHQAKEEQLFECIEELYCAIYNIDIQQLRDGHHQGWYEPLPELKNKEEEENE